MKDIKVYEDHEMLEFLHNCEKSVFEALDMPNDRGEVDLDDFVITIQGHELHLCPGADNFEAITCAVKECYDMYVEENKMIEEIKTERECNCDGCAECAGEKGKEPAHIKDILKDLFGDLIDKEEIEDTAGTGGIIVMVGRKK